jgi:hypothetical protein
MEESFVHWNNTDVANWSEIKQATSVDILMSSIIERIKGNIWARCSEAERSYKTVRTMLTVEDGVICKGDLLVPPPALRRKFIQSVHDDIPCGSMATRHRLKLEAWWPGHCEEVESYVRNCSTCARIKPPLGKKVHTWPQEHEAWSRVTMDHGYVNCSGGYKMGRGEGDRPPHWMAVKIFFVFLFFTQLLSFSCFSTLITFQNYKIRHYYNSGI